MNRSMIRYVLGHVLKIEGAFLLLPCLFAAIYREKEGFYYLIGNYDKYDNISHYRLDKMTCVEMLAEKVKPQNQVTGLEQGLDLPKHMAEHIYMFGGESVAINVIVDENRE